VRDFVLDGEDVVHLTVVAFRPQVKAIARLDELRRNTKPIARLANTACKDSGDAESPADFTDVAALPLELE
jgi:hypothetical protein